MSVNLRHRVIFTSQYYTAYILENKKTQLLLAPYPPGNLYAMPVPNHNVVTYNVRDSQAIVTVTTEEGTTVSILLRADSPVITLTTATPTELGVGTVAFAIGNKKPTYTTYILTDDTVQQYYTGQQLQFPTLHLGDVIGFVTNIDNEYITVGTVVKDRSIIAGVIPIPIIPLVPITVWTAIIKQTPQDGRLDIAVAVGNTPDILKTLKPQATPTAQQAKKGRALKIAEIAIPAAALIGIAAYVLAHSH